MWKPGGPFATNEARSVSAFYTPQGSPGSHHLLDRDYSASYTSGLPYVQENWESPNSPRNFLAGNIVMGEHNWNMPSRNK